MFRRFPFVALVCWVLATVIVFGISGAYSPERQTDARDFSALKESGTSLVSFAESIPLTLTKFAAK